MEISLKELKAQNRAAEEAEAQRPEVEPEEETQEPEVPEEDTEQSDKTDEQEEPEDGSESEESEGGEKPELEAWQQSEDSEDSQDDESSGFKPNPGAAKLRRKLKDVKQDRDETKAELEELKRKFEQLSSGGYKPQQQTQEIKRPKLEDYDYDEDKYNDALDSYYDKKFEAKLSQSTQQQQQTIQQQQAQQQAQKRIDDHYNRAAELVNKGLVKEDVFAEADGTIRQTIESVMPGRGDDVTDSLISKISGEGSEKLWVYLGRNASQLNRLRETLQSDPTGLTTMAMLGELKAKATKPIQVKSKAPKPAPSLKGDAKASKHSSLRKAYSESTDIGKRIEIKRAAKDKGEDVSKW